MKPHEIKEVKNPKRSLEKKVYLTHSEALTRRTELKLIAKEFRALCDDGERIHLKKIALCFDKLSTL